MLSRAGLRDYALFAHAPRQQDLADGVVDLVRSGMAEVLALEINLRAAELLRQPLGEVERRFPARVPAQILLELLAKGGVTPHRCVSPLQFR